MALTESQARRRQVVIGLAAGLGAWAIVAGVYLAGGFQAFDLRMLDWRFRLRGERPASDAIALVVADDATIHAYGGWPLPRDQYALLIQALDDAGARAIGIDLQLPEDNNHDPDHNALLAFVSSEHANVVHAMSFAAGPAGSRIASPSPVADREALERQSIAGALNAAPAAAGVVLPYSELVESAVAIGHITVAVDADGAIRRQPPLVQFENRLYASMALRMVGIGRGHAELPRVSPERGGVRIRWGDGPEWQMPLDREGAVSLDFAGDRRAFPHLYSMIDVLRRYRAGDTQWLRQQFAARYILVGLDSKTEVTEDVGTTPFAAATPLLFIHANVIDNMLRGRFLARLSPWLYLPALAVAAASLAFGFATLPMTIAAILGAAALAVTATGDLALLSLRGVDAPPVAALVLTPLVYAAVTSSRYLLLESRSRRRDADIREGRSIEQQFLPEALVGHDLSRYRVIEKIGGGGMGIVYRGWDPHLKRHVAIKVLPARALADETSRRRFRREALALARVSHPHIADIYDFDSQDGTDFLVLEFIDGVALAERIRKGPLPQSEVVRIMDQIARALSAAHAHGMIHRDLKSDNVMLTQSGDVKVLDFGIALILNPISGANLSSRLTETGSLIGTLPYMAPEMLRGADAGPGSDLYSLGVIAYEMATGTRPFPRDEPHELIYTILNQSPPEPRILNGRISRSLDEMILRLLSKDPGDRYATAAELSSALGALDTAQSRLATRGSGVDRTGGASA